MLAIKIINKNRTYKVCEETTLRALSEKLDDKKYITAALVDNEMQDLNFVLTKDCEVEFLSVTTIQGNKVYERSLLMLFVAAYEQTQKDSNIYVRRSSGRGVYCEPADPKAMITGEMLMQIKAAMYEMRDAAIPFNIMPMSRAEAAEMFACTCRNDVADILEKLEKDVVEVCELNGHYDYFHGKMLTSAADIYAFDIVQRPPGVVLLWPSRDDAKKISNYQADRKLFKEGYKYERWGNFLGVDDISSLNEVVKGHMVNDLIIIAEDRHQYFINTVADEIAATRKDVKIITMSGPTSSGKTTTSKRLRNQLIVRGVRPHTIEMDNYFFSRTETPLGEDGKPDFESLSAVDVALFNDHMEELLDGKEVQMPFYNFMTGQREAGEYLRIGEDDILIVEGIHGLNETLTKRIPRNKKYKVYLNTLTQLNIDCHNYIPTSDTRLVRRIVRDHRVRGNDVEATMTMWEKIRKGEETNIFPYQEEADFIVNTSLFYEFSVLRKYALPLLEKVEKTSRCYSEAQRLIAFLSYFEPIENERAILTNSIIREFIGGSIYDRI